MSDDKTITAWLIIGWRDGSHRTRQSKPTGSELGTNELLTKVEVDVSVPDVDVPTLAAKIDVPEPRVYAATMDALDDDDLPDWTDTANDQITQDEVAIDQADDGDLDRIVDSIVARTLMHAPGRPDPDIIQDYVVDMVYQVRDPLDDVDADAS
jgi:hypothetical protein